MGSTATLARNRLSPGGIAGILGVVSPGITLAVLPIWRFPGTGSTGAQIAQFVVVHRSALRAVMVLNTAGVSLWMIFGAAVWLRMRRATTAESLAAACFAFGLVGFVTLIMAGFVAFSVLVYRTPGPAQARVLYDLAFGLLAMSGMPTAIALGSYAVVGFGRRHGPRFIAELAALAAAAHVVLLFSFVVPSGFFSLEGQVITVVPALLFAWILATGMTMRRPLEDSALEPTLDRGAGSVF